MEFSNIEYNIYLLDHIRAVDECYRILTGKELLYHDASKYTEDEYKAYAEYFHPTDGSTPKSSDKKDAFRKAWLHHQNENKHHWQYWVLIDGDGNMTAIEMPEDYVREMVADWGSFAYLKKDGKELLEWYETNKSKMILHDKTRSLVEKLVPELTSKINAIFN